ncbi:MAG: hypothetical protein WA423_07055 [Candidatus Sulfotelmatobacter sp.]
MRFAKIVFWIAGIWGVLVLTPLFFIFNMIGRNDPPPITHPAFYYGFVSVSLTFQLVFFVIAKDPVRLRPMIIPSMLEKFGYGVTLFVLFLQNRLHPQDLALGGIDVLFGVLFLIAFFKTEAEKTGN